MKHTFKFSILALILLLTFSACEKEEGLLPEIEFKTGTGYTSSDATLPGGSAVKIGIEARKEEEKDPLNAFNISKSVDGGAFTTIYQESLTGADQDEFEYDYSFTLDSISGQQETYTFTVTNRDGLVGQTDLTLTIQ